MTAAPTARKQQSIPTTTFKVVCKQQKSSWRKTVCWSVLAVAILTILLGTIIQLDARNDANFPSYLVYFLMDFLGMETWFQQEAVWLVGGAVLGLVIFETTQGHRHGDRVNNDTELCVTICPLGVQRSTTRNGKTKCQPLLPTDSIKDCIVTEHVGAFSVTTHVMLRIHSDNSTTAANDESSNGQQSSSTSLIEAFPKACLTFDQCCSLRNQVQSALNEIR